MLIKVALLASAVWFTVAFLLYTEERGGVPVVGGSAAGVGVVGGAAGLVGVPNLGSAVAGGNGNDLQHGWKKETQQHVQHSPSKVSSNKKPAKQQDGKAISIIFINSQYPATERFIVATFSVTCFLFLVLTPFKVF